MKKYHFIVMAVFAALMFACEKTPENTENTEETVDFSGGIPAGFTVENCAVSNSAGHGDNSSLAMSKNGTIICRKTGNKTLDMVEFYLKGAGKVRFYMDSELKNKFETTDEWQRFSAYLSEAQHEIKWECTDIHAAPAQGSLKSVSATDGIYIDDIRFAYGFAPGKPHAGGIVAHVNQDGKTGLIVTISNQTTEEGISWDGGMEVETDVTATSYGNGSSNTAKIVAALGGGNYAAKLCFDLVQNGYDDWFLPTYDELCMIRNNCRAIGNFTVSGWYWSSTDYGYREAAGRPSGWKAAPVCISPDGLMCGNSPISEMRYQQYQVRAARYFGENR